MIDTADRIDMVEMLRRGEARVLYDGSEGAILLSGDGTMLTSDIQDGALLCEKVRALCPAVPEVFTLKSDAAAETVLRTFSLHSATRCTQWSYEKDKLPFPVTADVRLLPEVYAPLAGEVYHEGSERYIRDRIDRRALWGVFEGEMLAGFAGFHGEGSMGMLEILPPFRHRGYAMQLEALLIGIALSEGRTPYCHVIDGNEASLHLQRKMGLICADLPVIWID